jgi:Tol biopolymer transport system component
MSDRDLEDLLSRLKPLPAPESLWERARAGRPARARRSGSRDALLLAAAAALLATLAWIVLAPPRKPILPAGTPAVPAEAAEATLRSLRALPHRIVYESFREGSWDLVLARADGSGARNLTATKGVDELYPKVSPDGTRIAFIADEGEGEARRRSLWVMNLDGTRREKIADNAREPCWSADGSRLAYVRGETERFTYTDFATRGLVVYDARSGEHREHPNRALQHLYTLNWTPDGKWFIATVHGGMGFKHGVVAIEADGLGVFDLRVDGCCRPDLSPDGTWLAWGHGDYALAVGRLDLASSPPRVTDVRIVVQSADPMETYHADWSPDGRFLAFSYGPKSRGRNLQGYLPEFPGVEAPEWNICVADASGRNRFVAITADGASNKEPDWVRATAK